MHWDRARRSPGSQVDQARCSPHNGYGSCLNVSKIRGHLGVLWYTSKNKHLLIKEKKKYLDVVYNFLLQRSPISFSFLLQTSVYYQSLLIITCSLCNLIASASPEHFRWSRHYGVKNLLSAEILAWIKRSNSTGKGCEAKRGRLISHLLNPTLRLPINKIENYIITSP